MRAWQKLALSILLIAVVIYGVLRTLYAHLVLRTISLGVSVGLIALCAAGVILGALWLIRSLRPDAGEPGRGPAAMEVSAVAAGGVLCALSALCLSFWAQGLSTPSRLFLFFGFVFLAGITLDYIRRQRAERRRSEETAGQGLDGEGPGRDT